MNRRALAALAVVALAASAGCVGPLTGDQQPAESRNATVVGVVDGDTVDVLFADGTEERVRLLGVDTPEVHADVSAGEFEGVPDTEAGRSCLRSWGERASEYATERLAGESVTVEFDAESDRRGGYDRLLAYVIVDTVSSETPRADGASAVENQSFNRALLSEGYARLYDSEFTQRDDYAAVEQRARENGTGLWACAS